MSNRGKEWSEDELVLLGQMVRDKVPMRYIRTMLGRSHSAIMHALRNTMYHHLLDNDPEVIAARYGTTTECLATGIVPAKYRIPLPSTPCDSSDPLEDDATSPSPDAASHSVLLLLFGMCIGGMAYYAHVLFERWNALTVPS